MSTFELAKSETTIVSWVIPVLDEEAQLRGSVERLSRALDRLAFCRGRWQIIIADNGSTDMTPQIAQELAQPEGPIRYQRLDQRGRGRALKHAWAQARGEVLAYCDVDLSTDLAHVPELLGALLGERYDLAVGSRLLPGSVTRRGLRRETLSRGYSALTRWMFRAPTRDYQCGFKAIRRAAATQLLPFVENDHWFFDTELLILAQSVGFKIKEIPVRWTDDPDSRVKIMQTVIEDLRGLLRLRRQLGPKTQDIAERLRARLKSQTTNK